MVLFFIGIYALAKRSLIALGLAIVAAILLYLLGVYLERRAMPWKLQHRVREHLERGETVLTELRAALVDGREVFLTLSSSHFYLVEVELVLSLPVLRVPYDEIVSVSGPGSARSRSLRVELAHRTIELGGQPDKQVREFEKLLAERCRRPVAA